jgi:hypothetical protein
MSTLSSLSSNVTSARDHSQKYAFSAEAREFVPGKGLVESEVYYRELSSAVFEKFKERQYSDAINLAVRMPRSNWRDYTCSRLCESILAQNTSWIDNPDIRNLMDAITSETAREATRFFVRDLEIFREAIELIEPSETDTTSEEERFENARQTLQSIYWDKVGIGDRSYINDRLGLPTTIRFQKVEFQFLNVNGVCGVSTY